MKGDAVGTRWPALNQDDRSRLQRWLVVCGGTYLGIGLVVGVIGYGPRLFEGWQWAGLIGQVALMWQLLVVEILTPLANE